MRNVMRIVLAATAVCLAPAPRAVAQDYSVVVNSAVPGSTIAVAELARVFERRAVWWSNRVAVDPVDLNEDSPVRQRFSEDVLGKSVDQEKAYWQSQIFSGRGLPPVELAGDEEVLQYVRTHDGAVGYVSARARLPGGVRRMIVTP
jgi:hypothetical protein